jgi:hypothetical protein
LPHHTAGGVTPPLRPATIAYDTPTPPNQTDANRRTTHAELTPSSRRLHNHDGLGKGHPRSVDHFPQYRNAPCRL